MNSKLKFLPLIAAFALGATLCACTPAESGSGNGSINEPAIETPTEISSELSDRAGKIIAGAKRGTDKIPDNSTAITGKIEITRAGNYYVNSEIAGKKITVNSEGVTLFLSGAKLSNEKKVIESFYPLTVTLIGENTVENSNELGSNAIDCTGNLTVNGSGSLKITSTKNGIKANSVSVIDAKLEINSLNDGLHAEVEAYDAATVAPVPSYYDGGYVYLNGATVSINSGTDGIQSDTFVYISDSTVNITAGGGAPETPDKDSALTADGKGIKAGPVDWGADKTDVVWDEQLIHVIGGKLNIDSDDDAIHSDGESNIENCDVKISSGGDAVQAGTTIKVIGGTVNIVKCLKEYDAATVIIDGKQQ